MPSAAYFWAYGVIPRAHPAPPVTGVEGQPVEAISHGELTALVSTVPADRFDQRALQQRLEDMRTVEALALAHADVLDAALAARAVVPFPLCTIYGSRDAVERMLADEGGRLSRTLAALRDKAEWGVKAFASAPRADAQPAASSGTEYLARRRAQRAQEAASDGELDDAAARIHAELAAVAAAAVIARPQDRRLTGRDAEMVLNGAYLLGRDAADGFASLVAGLQTRHERLQLELTGPWPAFHFAGEPPA